MRQSEEMAPQNCRLCPRACGANRREQPGRCHGGAQVRVARAAPHLWEEPCLAGTRGSGTVFFSGCALGCVFCQNHAISTAPAGRALSVQELAGVFLRLQRRRVHNLNLVTASHYRPWVQAALAQARAAGLSLPVVWNTGGYESLQTVKALEPDVDVWLFDLKYHNPALGRALADAPDYFEVASRALRYIAGRWGPPRYDEEGLLRRGVLVRLLVLPGHRDDAKRILAWLASALPGGSFCLSLMGQYTPPAGRALPKELRRQLSSYEYRDVQQEALRLGFEDAYVQRRGSADEAYLPDFADFGDGPAEAENR